MGGKTVVLVPFAPDEVTGVWCHDRQTAPDWQQAWELADFAQITRPEDIEADLFGLALPYDSAWAARKFDGQWWYRADVHARWLGWGLDLYAADELIDWTLSLRGAERIEWIGRNGTGWPMPRGYYGLIAPVRECALVAGDALRWVVQTETPHGRYALVFDSLGAGRDGQPHPIGLWRLAEEA